MMAEYGGLAAVWFGWCLLHSLLAAEWWTAGGARILGASFRRYYRLFYNVFSVGSLVWVLQWHRAVGGEVVWVWAGAWRLLQIALVLAALVLFLLGLRRYDMRQFLGVAQWLGGAERGLATGGGVDTGGILGVVRHPWYLAIVLLLWARNLQTADLVANAVLMLYLVWGTILEERKLVAAFGAEYRAYQQRVSMLVPWKALRAWIQRSGDKA